MAEFRQVLHIHIDKRIDDYVQAKQNDTASRFLDCKLFNQYGVPYDLTRHKIRIALRKPDGTEVFNDGKLTRPTDGMFAFELTTQALSAVGIVQAEIKVITEDERITLTTKTFEIDVLEEIWSEKAVESSNEYGAVVQLFQDVWEVRQSIFGMEKSVGTPQDELTSGQKPTSLTLFGGINKIRNYLFNMIIPTIHGAKEEVNENVDNRFDELNERINFVAPTYVTIHKRGSVNATTNTSVRTLDIPIHTGSGILNSFRVAITNSGGMRISTSVIADSTVIGSAILGSSNESFFHLIRNCDIYFKSSLILRVSHHRTLDNPINSTITHDVLINAITE